MSYLLVMNLKLLNILSSTLVEQEDANDEYSGYFSSNRSPEQEEGSGEGDDYGKMIKYIRLFFVYLQSSGIDIAELINRIETEGIGYGDKVFNDIQRGMKYVGLEPQGTDGVQRQIMGTEDLVYLLLINYIHNGGDRRIFKKGKINLIPGTKWNVDVDSKEKIIELSTIYAEVYGNSQEKAENAILANPENFEVDRESYDHEYDDGIKFDTTITEMDKETFKLEPRVFNLKGPFPSTKPNKDDWY